MSPGSWILQAAHSQPHAGGVCGCAVTARSTRQGHMCTEEEPPPVPCLCQGGFAINPCPFTSRAFGAKP